jgi:hypothetical protein
MKPVYFVVPIGVVLTLAAALFIQESAVEANPAIPRQIGSASDKPAVYVSDFDLDVLPGDAGRSPSTATPPPAPPGTAKQVEDARKQASRIVDRMAANLVLALQKAGYTVVRLHSGDARPDNGLLLRGLFAEVDKENHWRRAVIRSASDSGKIQVLVGVANLTKPDQALYEVANLPGNENKPGAVITLSPYVPLAKFDLDKDPPEDALQKAAAHIVNDVTALLNANPAAVSQ